jgi:hypothetical protein
MRLPSNLRAGARELRIPPPLKLSALRSWWPNGRSRPIRPSQSWKSSSAIVSLQVSPEKRVGRIRSRVLSYLSGADHRWWTRRTAQPRLRMEQHHVDKLQVQDRLASALAAMFKRGATELPADLPDGVKRGFYNERAKQDQWKAFLEDAAVDPGSLGDVCRALAEFLRPAAARAGDVRLRSLQSSNTGPYLCSRLFPTGARADRTATIIFFSRAACSGVPSHISSRARTATSNAWSASSSCA